MTISGNIAKVSVLSGFALWQMCLLLPHEALPIALLSFVFVIISLVINYSMAKQNIRNSIIIFVVMMFIACGQTSFMLNTDRVESVILPFIGVVVLLAIDYSIATILNIRVLIPRLLLRNRYAEYAFYILIFVAIAIVINYFTVRVLIEKYGITVDNTMYSFTQNFMVFDVFSAVTSYFISFVGTGLLYFLHIWSGSNQRLSDLTKQNAHNKLEQTRTLIDAKSLFDTLTQAANHVKKAPQEVSVLLINLSKSLRTQLYESKMKQNDTPAMPSQEMLNLQSPIINLLIQKRYSALRHAAMIVWFALIVASNFDGTASSVLFLLTVPLTIWLTMIYLNIYVFIPKLLMQGKKMFYFITIFAIFFVSIMSLMFTGNIGFREINGMPYMLPLIIVASNAVKICLPILGVSVARFMQYWVRNQRRIAQLETSTMLAELDQLQNQVNPHFLFNMLNNTIVLTKTNPCEAETTLRKLNDMLKYQFEGHKKQNIRLADDIKFITDYLNLEKLRRDKFEFNIAVDSASADVILPPLLFIPFVENAVKHGNDNRNSSFVLLSFVVDNNKLRFSCINSKPQQQAHRNDFGGLGLPNIRRRLELLYGNKHELNITENESSYSVRLEIKLK